MHKLYNNNYNIYDSSKHNLKIRISLSLVCFGEYIRYFDYFTINISNCSTMSALFNKSPRLIQNTIILQQSKRYRGKINIQRPRAPHYEKARVLKLTEPYFPSKIKNLSFLELCGNLKPKIQKSTEDNKYQKILAKECLNWFNHSRLVTLFHLNPMTADERFNAFVAFKKSNMYLKSYGKETLQMALDGTNYEAFTQHYVSHNLLLFSPEINIKEMLKISKKFPQIIILSAILEGRYITKDELIKYSQIGNVQVARAEFVQTLQNVAGHFVHRLTQQQSTLVTRLQDRAEQLK